jgi:enoyl-[acyl-carrier protein] reductase II
MLALGAEGVAMGSRFATTKESPLASTVKASIVQHSESDTIYGKNFDGLYARVLRTKASEQAMRWPLDPFRAAYRSFGAARDIGLPLWKVIPGLLTQWDQMYKLSLFGAATKKLIAATVRGDLEHGVQFVGQSQGLIHDIPSVQELVDRCISEAHATHAAVGQQLGKQQQQEQEQEGVKGDVVEKV